MIFAAANWLGLGVADWAILAVYFVVILVIGLWSITKVKTTADFFMGGRRFGKIFMMFFAFGSGTSSEQAITVVAGTWRMGLVGIWWQFLWLWATPFYWIVAPIMRRMRALTTADFFESRYNSSTATLYSFYGIVMAIVFIAGGLYGSGKMVNALTGNELDRIAREMDIQVPELAMNLFSEEVGRKVLFEFPAESLDELDGGKIPERIQTDLAAQKRLSKNLALRKIKATRHWVIDDKVRGVSYPVRHVTVTITKTIEEKEPDATGKVKKRKKKEEVKEERIRVYGSGWRLMQGYEFAILAMTVLFVTYGMAGGLGAAIITDLIQGILTITFSFLLLPFVFKMIGGFGELHGQAGIKEGMLSLVADADVAASLGKEPITVFYVFMLSFTALAGIVVQPHIMGVCGAGKTEFEGRFGFTVGNFLKRFCTIAWTFTGLACIVWYMGSGSPLKHADKPLSAASGAAFDELSDADQQKAADAFAGLPEKEREKIESDRKVYQNILSRNDSESFNKLGEKDKEAIDKSDKDFSDKLFGRAAYDILPTIAPGLIGLLLASLLAAVMSTSDAQMVISSGLFTENIYRRFFAKNKSQRHYLWVGRIAGLVIVLFALVLQSTFTDVIDALKVILTTPAFIGISLWFGISWRKWNSYAVWVSTAAGIFTWYAVTHWQTDIYGWGIFADSMFIFDANGEVKSMADVWQRVTYMTVGISSGLLVSVIMPQQSKEKLDNFYRLMHTPVTPGEHIETPCTLPENPAPQQEKLFNVESLEIPKPTWVDMGGFAAAWVGVGLIIWLTTYLAKAL